MRATVAQAQERSGIGEHLADRLMVAADIVHQREVEVPVLVPGDVIVGYLVGPAPFTRSDRGDTLLLARLVVRWISHDKELVPALDDELAELRQFCHFGLRWIFRKNLAADFGLA